jgi:hypothetical protein
MLSSTEKTVKKILIVESVVRNQEWFTKNLNRHELVITFDADWGLTYWRHHRPFDMVIMGEDFTSRKIQNAEMLIEAIHGIDPTQKLLRAAHVFPKYPKSGDEGQR